MMSLSEALGVFADPVGWGVILVGQTGAWQPVHPSPWTLQRKRREPLTCRWKTVHLSQ